jgi:hypothetical protein
VETGKFLGILGKFLLTGDIGSEEELKPKKENRKWT